jgi:hypothetical protein
MSIGGEGNDAHGALQAAGEQIGDQAREWLHGATPLDLSIPRARATGGRCRDDRLAFDHADRLPWLEGDDDEDYAGLTASA